MIPGIEDIRERIGKDSSEEGEINYSGIDMSAIDFKEQENIHKDNYFLLKTKFPEEFKGLKLENFELWCMKGSIWWGTRKYPLRYLSGKSSEGIILWLLKNEGMWNPDKSNRRIH